MIIQRRAVYLTRDMKAGEVLTETDIFPLRPAKEGGIRPYEIEGLIGKTLKQDVKKDVCLRWEDVK